MDRFKRNMKRAGGDPRKAAKLTAKEILRWQDQFDWLGRRKRNPSQLCKENDRLKRKLESFQGTLDEIADVASASADGSEDEDELREKLNTILDLAAPDSAYEEEDNEEDE